MFISFEGFYSPELRNWMIKGIWEFTHKGLLAANYA